MTPAYAAKLYLKVCYIKVKVEKIDGFTFKTFKIVLAYFQVKDKLKKVCFFYETFLLADITIEMVIEIFFLTFSNADMSFSKRKLTQTSYTTTEALLTTK